MTHKIEIQEDTDKTFRYVVTDEAATIAAGSGFASEAAALNGAHKFLARPASRVARSVENARVHGYKG